MIFYFFSLLTKKPSDMKYTEQDDLVLQYFLPAIVGFYGGFVHSWFYFGLAIVAGLTITLYQTLTEESGEKQQEVFEDYIFSIPLGIICAFLGWTFSIPVC